MADRTAIRDALADLHARGEHSSALAQALGMAPITSPVNLARNGTAVGDLLSGRVSELYRVGEASLGTNTAGLYLAFADEWHARSSDREPYRRKVARVLVEHMPQDGRWVCVLMDGLRRNPEAEVILPRRRQGAKATAGTTRAAVNLKDPTHHHLSLLAGLDARGLTSLAALSRKWNDEFSVEVVTNRFHREFRELRDRFVIAVVDANPANPAIAPLLAGLPADARTSTKKREEALLKDLHLLAFGTRQLGRLLFLWFLQQKRWLGGAPGNGFEDYLEDLFKRHTSPAGDGYFNDVLGPIFFDALGQPESSPAHRAAVAKFGPLPFLGGGLFRPDPFEEQLFDIPGGSDERRFRVGIPDALFAPAVQSEGAERTILGFLKGYRFTTQESTPDNQSVDPDPELLGKVFENLYQEDDRHETGAYYTPREIVHYMCRQALDGYLRDQANVSQDTLDGLRTRAIDWTASDQLLDPGTAEALHHALDHVTVLDPAVGSGAFLVGTMQEIVLLRRGFEQSQVTHDINPRSLDVADWKRRAITQSLHGVDINPMAVEICKLRLWLSLVVDLELEDDGKPINLPDLDFRILAGDSLVDRMGAEPFLQSLPDPRAAGFQPDMAILQKVNALQHQLEGLKLKFGGEGVTPAEQRDLARRIRRAELEIARVQLDHAKYWAAETVEARRKNPKTTKKALKEAQDHLGGLERLEAGLHEDTPFQKPFLWPVNFHEVTERGGFDIVLANPPYVRQEKLDPIDQSSFAHAFEGVHTGTADLFVYFYERAIQLLRDGGQLAFITSNKYMRAAYGEGLRGFLPKQMQLHQVIGFGDLPLFTVAAYPAVVTGQKAHHPVNDAAVEVADLVHPIRRRLLEQERPVNHLNVRLALEDLPAILEEAAVRDYPQALLRTDGWILEDPALVRLFDRLMSQGTPLGEYVKGRMYRGALTGLNEAFVIDQAKRDELVAADPKSAELTKPWLRGRDIKRWKAEWAGLYLIAIQNSGDADSMNPWASETNEADARRVFRREYPALHDHLSQFESRLRPRADQGKWWWELRACAYYKEFEQPKVIWPRNVPPWEARFAWDEQGGFINDKGYVLGGLGRDWVGYLNSPVVFWMLDKLTTKLQGGWLELKSDTVVGRVPIPAHWTAGSTELADVHRRSGNALGLSNVEARGVWEWYSTRAVYRRADASVEPDDED